MPTALLRRLVAAFGALAVAVPLVAATAAPAGAQARVELLGHGWGHGRGMGQYGSLGYAIDHGWNHRQIGDHFYGNTAFGHLADGYPISVRLLNQDGKSLTVKVTSGTFSSNPGGPAPNRALRIEPHPSVAGAFRLSDSSSCGGPFTPRPDPVAANEVTVIPPSGGTSRDNLLQLCEYHGDGSVAGVRWYRGNLTILRTDFGLRTVNHLAMEEYLKGVVPRESPASWADLGGGTGAHALRAQAVAARSYAAAENRFPYAKTCDTISCQVYRGHAHQPVGGSINVLEDSRSDAAIAATAKEIRIRDGVPARTEFSSSTGGWSAGGVFPAVADQGDDVSHNPNHVWTTHLPFSSIEGKYGKGSLYAVDIQGRNGLGAEGGRVTAMRLRFSRGDVSLSGDDFRRDFALKSNWFSVRNLGPADTRTEPAGGWLLRADGSLQRFGGAPSIGPSKDLGAQAHAAAIGGPKGASGYVVDGFGELYPVGGAPAPADGGARWDFDIARDVALRRNGTSGWILDGYGALHPFGGAPKPTQQSGAWVSGTDTARHLLTRVDGSGGYVVKANGTVFAWGAAPAVSASALPSGRTAVAATLHPAGDRGWVIDDTGKAHPFVKPSQPAPSGFTLPAPPANLGSRLDGRSGYFEPASGGLSAFGGATEATLATTVAASVDVVDVVLAPEPAGYVLDGFGGIHAFGGAPKAISHGYWPGQNVAQKLVAFPGGGGFVMDSYGQLYPFNTQAGAAPPLPWQGRRLSAPLARDITIIPGTRAGYVLDGWGGLHPFGGAPPVTKASYWPNWDIAKAVAVNPSGTGGHVLDAWGAVHAFGIGSNPKPPAQKASAYWPGWKIVRDMALTGENQGYTVDGFGGVHPFGGTTGHGSWYWSGRDLATAAASDGSDRDWIVYLDAWGGTHTGGTGSPLVTPQTTWPQWSIARDVGLVPR